jgi:flagellar biosynthesis GTPase FlhF
VAIRRTLYEVLQITRAASPEIISSAYEGRLRSLGDSAAPEVLAERQLIRDAHSILTDPVRRKLYDDKLREQAMRAAGSGGDVTAVRSRMSTPAVEPSESSPLGWMIGIAVLAAVAIGGAWVYLSHKQAVEAQRMEEARQAEQARQRETEAQRQRENMEWAKAEYEKRQKDMEFQKWEAQRQRDRIQIQHEQQQNARQQAAAEQRAAMDRQRQEQENLRRSQAELARQQRYLQELERNRAMRF